VAARTTTPSPMTQQTPMMNTAMGCFDFLIVPRSSTAPGTVGRPSLVRAVR
jgi:hypothetical protein